MLLLPLKERIIAFKLDEQPVNPWISPVVLLKALAFSSGYLPHRGQFQALMLATLSQAIDDMQANQSARAGVQARCGTMRVQSSTKATTIFIFQYQISILKLYFLFFTHQQIRFAAVQFSAYFPLRPDGILIIQMRGEPQPQRQYYQQLKSQLLEPRQFPNINRMLNLPAFIKENESLFVRLSTELIDLKNNQKKAEKNIKIKTTPFYLNTSTQNNNRDDEKLKELRARNELLQNSIAAQKSEEERRKKEELPLLKQKKQELKQKESEREKVQQLNKQLKRAQQSQDLLELYQSKCRECEALRKVNNEISEQIKSVIKEINQLTGSDQNPNMFFMNLKV